MTKIRIILENDLGESIDLKSYELGTDLNKMYGSAILVMFSNGGRNRCCL